LSNKESIPEEFSNGAFMYNITFFDLKPEGFMSEEERQVFDNVLSSKTLAEINININNELTPFAINGAVASGDVEKLEFVLKSGRFPQGYGLRILKEIIKAGAKNHVAEDTVLKMLESLVNVGAPIDKYAVGIAADKGYYNIAQYFIDHQAKINPLNGYDLYDMTSKDDRFESFKWLMEHGAKVESGLAGRIACMDFIKGINKWQFEGFDTEEKANKALDFLIEIGVTDTSYVAELKQKCDIIEKINDFFKLFRQENMLISAIKNKAPASEIKFLLDNGLKIDNFALPKTLINYPDTQLVQLILDEYKLQNTKTEYDEGRDFCHFKNEIFFNLQDYARDEYCKTNLIIAEFACVTGEILAKLQHCVAAHDEL
jgi:hypothetical protein